MTLEERFWILLVSVLIASVATGWRYTDPDREPNPLYWVFVAGTVLQAVSVVGLAAS